jgi:hypothetical protein
MDLLFNVGRVLNCKKRISLLKIERVGLLDDRNLFEDVLDLLHIDSFAAEAKAKALELDLVRASLLLDIYKSMTIIWNNGKALTIKAQRDYKRADMRLCGLYEDVTEAVENVSSSGLTFR